MQELLSRLSVFQDLSDKTSDLLACLAIPDDNASPCIRDLLAIKRAISAAVARHVTDSRRGSGLHTAPAAVEDSADISLEGGLSSRLLVRLAGNHSSFAFHQPDGHGPFECFHAFPPFVLPCCPCPCPCPTA